LVNHSIGITFNITTHNPIPKKINQLAKYAVLIALVVLMIYPKALILRAEAISIIGTKRDDSLMGTNRNDVIVGLGGNDRLDGETGNDIIIGGSGDDKLLGEEGKDVLIGNRGNDLLVGGPGNDTFECGPGADKIEDFNPSGDKIKGADCELITQKG
jgi:Ca2+-binding RTX toxin-like protein